MFFGAHLRPSVPFIPSRKDGGELLHLSQLCLYNPKQSGRTYVQVVEGNNTFCIASLEKDKIEQVSVDLFLSTENDLKLQTSGAANEVHVVGFFEPEPSDLDDEEDFKANIHSKKRQATGQVNKDKGKTRRRNEESDDEDELSNELKKLIGMDKTGKASDTSGELEGDDDDEELLDDEAEEDDEEDDDDEEDEEDDEDENDENNEEDEDEDEDDAEEISKLKLEPNKKSEKTKPLSNGRFQALSGKNSVGKGNDGSKKVSKTLNATENSDTYQLSLVQYLKAHGKTNISLLGSKVKKPTEVSERLGAFLKNRPTVFKIEDGSVMLVE